MERFILFVLKIQLFLKSDGIVAFQQRGKKLKKDLEKRLVYLFTGEFFAIIVFNFVFFYHALNPNKSYSILYVFFILNFILLQGGFYWFVKWRSLKSKRMIFPNLHKILDVLKKINLILICIAPIILLFDIFVLERVEFSRFILTMFIYVFAIVEYINYFHVQLTNYKNGRGMKSSIAK